MEDMMTVPYGFCDTVSAAQTSGTATKALHPPNLFAIRQMSYLGVRLIAQVHESEVLGFWTGIGKNRYYPKTFLCAQFLFLI
jgi:hypothetical protein